MFWVLGWGLRMFRGFRTVATWSHNTYLLLKGSAVWALGLYRMNKGCT